MSEPSYDNAAHKLRCKHCRGRSFKRYWMRCHILKVMGDGLRLKVLVFGDRFWLGAKDKSRVRYVDRDRVYSL